MDRISALRNYMKKWGVNAFITPSTDPHSGEYVPKHWESRSWLSGFNGSAGTAVVTLDKAALWTDSRYFLQAEEQIKGTGFVLMKDKLEETPTIEQWLSAELKEGDVVGIDGWVNTVTAVEEMKSIFESAGIGVKEIGDPFAEIWEGRPELPDTPVIIQGLEYSGESAASKIERIRQIICGGKDQEKGCWKKSCGVLVSLLDEVCWTLNLRGEDIDYNPVFVSYLLITNSSATLFVNPAKISAEVADYLKGEGVEIKEYEKIAEELRLLDIPVWAQPEKTNFACYSLIKNPVRKECPVSTMKIMKNEVEIEGYRSAMLKDGIALVKWLKWVVPAVEKGGQTEMSLVRKLYALRAEQPLFKGDSFANIMGYGYHGAVVHYEPTDETDIPVYPEGLLLCDVGSQYRDGTTDMTRTIPLGPLTEQMKRDYTLVLKGWINLGRVHFPRGTYGSQLDVLSRAPMWEYGINFLHGTGHGVGSYLNCHEGPHQFRMNYMPQPLYPTMTITDEPGIYIEGSHGVRHENTMLVVEDKEGVTFGPYYKFEPLTLCPIFTSPIVTKMLDDDEKKWFNDYQQLVYEKLAPHLDDEHREWLKEICAPI